VVAKQTGLHGTRNGIKYRVYGLRLKEKQIC